MTKVEEKTNNDVNNKSEQSEELTNIIQEINDSSTQVNALLDSLKEELRSGKLNTDDGISLLDVKNQMMMNYLINIVYIITKKCYGKSISGDEAVDRLVEIRTVLERIRPLEHKLKYMMEKMVKAALIGVEDENDPTLFRANPENMMNNMGDSDESEEDEPALGKKSDNKSGVYVPPKLAPMHYEEEENHAARRQKQLDRAKKRALHGSVIEELREEYLDTPTEISHSNTLKDTLGKRQRLKNQYEEEYFTRLPSSKKDRHRARHSMTVSNIGDHLTHFENIQVLEDNKAFTNQKKHKLKDIGKQKKKKAFKRRKHH